MTITQISPAGILKTGLGFWASKTLLAAVELDLFTFLANGPRRAEEIRKALDLHPRSVFDFLDTLTALEFLQREGKKKDALYRNTPEADTFLVRDRPGFLGGMLQMANRRLYRYWGDLETALRTGQPQNESKYGGYSIFDAIYANRGALEEFLSAMENMQRVNFKTLVEKFDFASFDSFCDVGGAGASLSIILAQEYPHLQGASFDLQPLTKIAQSNIKKAGLSDRISAIEGDFFKDQLPSADVIIMGNVLQNWGIHDKMTLIRKAYEVLPPGGVFIAIESIIDNDRRRNLFGLMMSLNLLIETKEGFDYAADEFTDWARLAGFKEVNLLPLQGPASAAVAYKR